MVYKNLRGILAFETFADFPESGDLNYYYIDLSNQSQYYWIGSAYVEFSTTFGTYLSYQKDVTSFSSNSTRGYTTDNLTVVASVLLTPIKIIGNYRINVNFSYITSATNRDFKYAVYVNNVKESDTYVFRNNQTTNVLNSNILLSYSNLSEQTLNIELRMASQNASMTVTINTCFIEIWKI